LPNRTASQTEDVPEQAGQYETGPHSEIHGDMHGTSTPPQFYFTAMPALANSAIVPANM